MILGRVLLLVPALAWALPNEIPPNKIVLPREEPTPGPNDQPTKEWNDKIDQWERDRKPPEALVYYMRYYKFFHKDATEEPTLEDYKQPNEYLKTILSPGDSYTAGIGSNSLEDHYADSGWFSDGDCGRYAKAWPEQLRDHPGWNDLQGEGERKNNFGACSGHLIGDIEEFQLGLGENKDGDKFKKIGNPQIAVLTAGGNDFKFGDVVQDCILGILGTGNCETDLKGIEDMLSDEKRGEYKYLYQELFSHLIMVGRLAKGANPPESFQVYIGTYVPFFNKDDDVCSQWSWNIWSSTIKLDKPFRERLNNMVEGVNSIIREAADEMREWGVYYVDKYQSGFDGHRFCDPVPRNFDKWDDRYDWRYHSDGWQDFGSQTHFWSWASDWDPVTGYPGEGYDHPIWSDYGGPLGATDGSNNRPLNTRKILENLIPDAEQRAKVKLGEDPAQYSDAFKDRESLRNAIKNIQTDDEQIKGIIGWFTDDSYFRIWHPKGSALTKMADGFFETIKMWRSWDFKNQQ